MSTPERQSQAPLDLRAFIDCLPALAWTALPDGSVECFNQQFTDYSGWTPQQIPRAWRSSDELHRDDLERFEEWWREILESRKPAPTEVRFRRADGEYRWFQISAAPIYDERGSLVRWCGINIDIDDRKRAEQKLQQNEQSLYRITQTIPGMLWRATPEGAVDYCNRPWLDFASMTAEQAEGWGWAAAIYPEDRDGLLECWRSCLASGTPFDMEARMRRFDGAYRWFIFRANPLRDESGNIVRWYGTNIEIEDRKRREEVLQANELSWRQILDNIPGFVHTTSAMGEPEFINRQTLEYFNKTREELTDWSRLNIVHPDDLPRATEGLAKAIEAGQSYEIEHRCRRADGVYRWFQVRARPVRNADGEITAWYWLLIDIEDRKRAEAELEKAYHILTEAQRLSKTGSFITDLLADEHNWSEEAFRIFEFDRSTKVTVQIVRDVVHPEDLQSFDAAISRGMAGKDVDFVFRIVTHRGAVKHVRGITRVVELTPGRALFTGALQDVTEIKIAEEALNKARSELAHVARVTTLNALTASIAHEVNQPLSGIITNASTCLRMLDGDPPNVDGARETARRAIRDGKRASDVISRLRALFSKGEFTPEQVDLNEATQEVISLSLSDLQRNRVILSTDLADDLPPVTGDRVQLQQVILNLLRNASDAMGSVDDRPRNLLIRTDWEEVDGVRLSVKDVGIGFPPGAADKLFQAFYTTKNDGMGIGLSVSRSIIEAHHGRLWATANDGPGATFSFAIPRRLDGSVDIETLAARDPATNAA